MTGTAVTTVNKGRQVLAFDPTKIDYKAVAANMARVAAKHGGSVGGVRRFPGKQLMLVKDKGWLFGSGKDQVTLKKDTTFVVNVMAGILCHYARVGDGDEAKSHYSDLAKLASITDDIPTLEDWLSEKGIDVSECKNDPVTMISFPIRDVDGTEINHLRLGSKTAFNAGSRLFQDIANEMPMHMGQLPVIAMGIKKINGKVPNNKGKMVDATWDGPDFKVIDWVDMQPCDDPKNAADLSATSDDVGEVQAVERSPKKAASAEAKKPEKTKRKINLS